MLTMPEIDRTSEVSAFSKHAVWTGASDSDRRSWLRARGKLITASRVPALLGLSPREDAIDVYADAVRADNDVGDVDHGLQSPLTWGKALERAIAETAAQHYGWNLRMSGALLASRKYPFIGCTQDAELEEVPGSGEWISYEGKTTSQFRSRDWNEDDAKAPDHVIAQAQTQLLVTGAPKSVLSCLVGGNKFIRVDLDPSPEFFSLIVEACSEMMERIKSLDPPPATWRSKSAISKLHPEDDGSSVLLGRDALEWTRELNEIAPTIQELERRKKALENSLRLAIGKASVGVLPEAFDGKDFWTNTVVHRAGHTVAPSTFRQLRLTAGKKKGSKKS